MTKRLRHFVFLALWLVAGSVVAQTQTLSGRVTDDEGEPLTGVFVIVQNASKADVAAGRGGSLTDKDGRYKLAWSGVKAPRIQFTYIGMKAEVVEWKGQKTLDVTMHSDEQQLDDVVVTGVQTIEKGRATGSFKILDQKAMKNIYSTNLVEKLEGTTPGLLVNSDNTMTIRGLGSMRTTTAPLLVVDGYPMESSVLNLNPADIEQITVLKDAASASIWGIRAANGVIVVTTKRGGKTPRPRITYSGTLTVAKKIDLGDLHELASDQYARLVFEDYDHDSPLKRSLASGEYNEVEKLWVAVNDTKTMTREQAMAELAKVGAYSNRSLIRDNFYRSPLTHQHTLSLQAGGERSSVYASMNFDQNLSKLRGNQLSKVNLMLNTDYKLTHTLTTRLNVRATQQWEDRDGDGSQFTKSQPWDRYLNDDGTYFDRSIYSYNDEFKRRALALGLKDFRENPLEAMRMNDKQTKSTNISASLALEWEPIKNLKLSTTGTYENGHINSTDYYSADHQEVRGDFNYFTQIDRDERDMPTAIVKSNLPATGGYKDFANESLTSYSWRSQISYSLDYKDFNFRAMAGNDIYSLMGDTFSDRLYGYNDKYQTNVPVNVADLVTGVKGISGSRVKIYNQPGTSDKLERYVSWFGTASASYKDRYNIFGSIRLDQTNLLTNSSEFRNNPSWSVGGKWNITSEEFFPKTSWIDNLALRLSYGMSGNINKTTSPDMTGRFSTDWTERSLSVINVLNPANPSLGWEKNYTVNVGLDASLFHHRLSLTLDYYNRRCCDLLSSIMSDPTVGWGSYMANAASMTNRGIEAAINGTVIKTRDWTWDAALNLTYNRNRVTDCLPVSSYYYMALGSSQYIVGKPLNAIYSFRYGGLDEKGEPTFLRGDGKQESYSRLSTLTADDVKYEGDQQPPVFGSFTTSLRWKRVTLSAMLTFKLGHKMRMPSPTMSTGYSNYTEWIGEDYRWIEGADNTGKWVPRLYTGSGGNSLVVNDYWRCLDYSDHQVESANVLRLKSIRLEYDLTHWLRRIHLTGGSVALAGENLAFWAANREGLDPDCVISTLMSTYTTSFTNTPARLVLNLNLTF